MDRASKSPPGVSGLPFEDWPNNNNNNNDDNNNNNDDNNNTINNNSSNDNTNDDTNNSNNNNKHNDKYNRMRRAAAPDAGRSSSPAAPQGCHIMIMIR